MAHALREAAQRKDIKVFATKQDVTLAPATDFTETIIEGPHTSEFYGAAYASVSYDGRYWYFEALDGQWSQFKVNDAAADIRLTEWCN